MSSSRRSLQPAAATTSSSSDAANTAATPTAPPTSAASASAEAGPSTSAKPQPDKREEASTDAHLELLTEHFGYNPKSFIDALVYLSNEHLYSIATEFENVVMDLLKDVDGGELEAEQGMHAILTLMENSLDHTLDTFELYCFRSVFGIRSRQAKYMTLDHHRGLDLRTKQANSATSSSRAQAKPARKSLVGASTNLSANERSYRLGETEDSLKRQIAAARATQHKLLLAQSATQESLDRMLDLAERFSSILYHNTEARSAVPVLTETLGQHARKLKADTIPLLKALRELRSADPLGAPLYSGAIGGAANKDAADAEGDDDGVADVRVWGRGREPYLIWAADQIITKSKRGGATTSAAATSAHVEADATLAEATEDDSRTPKRTRTLTGQLASSKRRTPGTATRSRS
ncbi:hypothetical protein EX895_001626 [Sporisorium graminicola]|uniref:Uncharacterized protein n=1 Tax=Sporisorium graminicola TaxID=280036 RepID=A0A4U7KWH4_9BASI|nr:hypothetical protein EX895_001626 [Sporisorium graminicola]TKY89095.1 hypothetical protein EX895_001626 [Sporisorium graminicola]